MLAEIERLGRGGVSLDELETMRAGLKSSLIMAQESSMSRSGFIVVDSRIRLPINLRSILSTPRPCHQLPDGRP